MDDNMSIESQSMYKTFAVLVLSALAVPALGQEVKIGVVNINVLMEQSPQAQVAMEALQEEFAPRQRTILAKQKEFEEATERANRDAAVMGETERRNTERELRDMQRDLQRMQEEFREDLNLRRNEEIGNLQRSDRKSTRLNSSHVKISYAVFCVKKKKTPARQMRCARICHLISAPTVTSHPWCSNRPGDHRALHSFPTRRSSDLVMGETERRNTERELRDMQRDLQRMQEEFREDLNLRRNEEIGNLQR